MVHCLFSQIIWIHLLTTLAKVTAEVEAAVDANGTQAVHGDLRLIVVLHMLLEKANEYSCLASDVAEFRFSTIKDLLLPDNFQAAETFVKECFVEETEVMPLPKVGCLPLLGSSAKLVVCLMRFPRNQLVAQVPASFRPL